MKRSWQTDDTILRIHILQRFGALHLDEISNQAVADLLSRMRDQGYASGTVNRVSLYCCGSFSILPENGEYRARPKIRRRD